MNVNANEQVMAKDAEPVAAPKRKRATKAKAPEGGDRSWIEDGIAAAQAHNRRRRIAATGGLRAMGVLIEGYTDIHNSMAGKIALGGAYLAIWAFAAALVVSAFLYL
ncbi:MAG: hypothetical protein AAF677_12280 [Pseudomonadota bacterium]